MNLQDYISSGILEKYVLGLASPQEMEEIKHLRKLLPEIRAELMSVELRIEKVLLDAPVAPPAIAFSQVMQRLDWQQTNHSSQGATPHTSQPSYLLQSGKTMTISIWWRCAFLVVAVLAIVFAISTLYFYHRAQAFEQLFWRR
ncbi:hypothetical protein GA0116948_12010 [Chitinophaga costaii]|uniref:Uncharacterized protein n=1 Tax=Chitinophaga costaii TaxID=1335309 RepID=A0A1C4G241_9BACT|nr:hypothetical protein [Chitinophaga costaii]PUZ19772.1 hypothetical protein DCM91_20070 [Chitinophaga costaii]SCC62258.1 hypothetical protein GA0116948_12010 [Chitinophaga costaii]